jgi:hypothetical protein
MATRNTKATSLVMSLCAQEHNKQYEADNNNRVTTTYPDEDTNADYQMDGTQHR